MSSQTDAKRQRIKHHDLWGYSQLHEKLTCFQVLSHGKRGKKAPEADFGFRIPFEWEYDSENLGRISKKEGKGKNI